jgi:cyclic dehypoxanthinyl futalosine synthase
MMRLRDLQDETGGFTAFITWSYQPDHGAPGTEMGVDYLRTLAIAGSCSTLRQPQASWVTQGGKVGR